MKRRLLLSSLIFSFSLFLPLLQPSSVFAQSCTGDHGGTGDCTAPMACPPANIDGTGTCTAPDICCLTSLPPGDGGSGDCSDICTTSADCLDTPINLACTNGVCNDPATCSPCQGTSGFYGSCLTESVCAGKGKNSNDGTGSCLGGNICCTNAPSPDSCTLTAPAQVPSGTEFSVTLNSTEENTLYTITTSPPNCLGSCLINPTTDPGGNLTCTLACGPPDASYTITARHGPVTCTATVVTANIPGTPCTGNSGGIGWCHVGPFCPQNTYPDGIGTCIGTDVNCCVISPGGDDGVAIFCPTPSGGLGIRTAIGCIYASDPRAFINQIIALAVRIAAGITLLSIVYSGFVFTTAFGNKDRIVESKELLFNSVIYLFIIALAVVILNFLGVKVLGLSLLGFQI